MQIGQAAPVQRADLESAVRKAPNLAVDGHVLLAPAVQLRSVSELRTSRRVFKDSCNRWPPCNRLRPPETLVEASQRGSMALRRDAADGLRGLVMVSAPRQSWRRRSSLERRFSCARDCSLHRSCRDFALMNVDYRKLNVQPGFHTWASFAVSSSGFFLDRSHNTHRWINRHSFVSNHPNSQAAIILHGALWRVACAQSPICVTRCARSHQLPYSACSSWRSRSWHAMTALHHRLFCSSPNENKYFFYA